MIKGTCRMFYFVSRLCYNYKFTKNNNNHINELTGSPSSPYRNKTILVVTCYTILHQELFTF